MDITLVIRSIAGWKGLLDHPSIYKNVIQRDPFPPNVQKEKVDWKCAVKELRIRIHSEVEKIPVTHMIQPPGFLFVYSKKSKGFQISCILILQQTPTLSRLGRTAPPRSTSYAVLVSCPFVWSYLAERSTLSYRTAKHSDVQAWYLALDAKGQISIWFRCS